MLVSLIIRISSRMNEDHKAEIKELDHVETHPNTVVGSPVDTILSTLVAQDNVPWYRKRNLRKLYLLFIGSVLCIETTSGYDASVVNGLQAVPRWNRCKFWKYSVMSVSC